MVEHAQTEASEKTFLRLSDVHAYKTAFHLSNYVWHLVVQWDRFARDTIGKQFARSVDSISSNIAEGFGRYNKQDKIHFYRYSYGSIKESLDWNEKAKLRNITTREQYEHIFSQLTALPKQVNALIKLTSAKLKI